MVPATTTNWRERKGRRKGCEGEVDEEKEKVERRRKQEERKHKEDHSKGKKVRSL